MNNILSASVNKSCKEYEKHMNMNKNSFPLFFLFSWLSLPPVLLAFCPHFWLYFYSICASKLELCDWF